MGANIAGVVRADLERSGLFKPHRPKAFVEHITNINTVPNFANWRVINAQGLVAGAGGRMLPDGRSARRFPAVGRLWRKPDAGHSNSSPSRRIGAASPIMVSDAIYQRITGESGYFDTRIVFISESGPAIKRIKRLAVMDEDGANPIFLTRGDYMVLTPRFNPTAQMIAYMSYIATKPHIYLFDLETGKQEELGNFPNMTFSPRFSPDGNKVALALENGGQFRHLCDGFANPRGPAPHHRSGDRQRAVLLAGRHARSPSNPTAAAPSKSM